MKIKLAILLAVLSLFMMSCAQPSPKTHYPEMERLILQIMNEYITRSMYG